MDCPTVQHRSAHDCSAAERKEELTDDALGDPADLGDQAPMLVATTCPACDHAHAWRVDDREPPIGDQIAHFLVPTARMWNDVVYTCGNQRISAPRPA